MVADSTALSHNKVPWIRSRTFLSRLRSGDQIAYLITAACAASIFVVTVLLVYELWINSSLARHKFGWNFLFSSAWDPVAGDFGALPFIYGTVVTSILALLIAVPLGLGAADFFGRVSAAENIRLLDLRD